MHRLFCGKRSGCMQRTGGVQCVCGVGQSSGLGFGRRGAGEGLSEGARTLSFKKQEPVRIYKRRRELIIYVVLEDQLVQ